MLSMANWPNDYYGMHIQSRLMEIASLNRYQPKVPLPSAINIYIITIILCIYIFSQIYMQTFI